MNAVRRSRVLPAAVRLLALMRLFDGGTKAGSAELAVLLRCSQRTVNRMLLDLQSEPLYYPLMQDTDWRWRKMSRQEDPG